MQDIGLVAHYDFSEGVGTVLHDRSGNGNDGTIVGAQWITRRSGYCLEFDGIDDYVDCGHGASLDLTGAVTLEAWALLDACQGEAGSRANTMKSCVTAEEFSTVGGGPSNRPTSLPCRNMIRVGVPWTW